MVVKTLKILFKHREFTQKTRHCPLAVAAAACKHTLKTLVIKKLNSKRSSWAVQASITDLTKWSWSAGFKVWTHLPAAMKIWVIVFKKGLFLSSYHVIITLQISIPVKHKPWISPFCRCWFSLKHRDMKLFFLKLSSNMLLFQCFISVSYLSSKPGYGAFVPFHKLLMAWEWPKLTDLHLEQSVKIAVTALHYMQTSLCTTYKSHVMSVIHSTKTQFR